MQIRISWKQVLIQSPVSKRLNLDSLLFVKCRRPQNLVKSRVSSFAELRICLHTQTHLFEHNEGFCRIFIGSSTCFKISPEVI
jgi:hypothetical protein